MSPIRCSLIFENLRGFPDCFPNYAGWKYKNTTFKFINISPILKFIARQASFFFQQNNMQQKSETVYMPTIYILILVESCMTSKLVLLINAPTQKKENELKKR